MILFSSLDVSLYRVEIVRLITHMYTTPQLKMKRLDLKTKENIIVSKEKFFISIFALSSSSKYSPYGFILVTSLIVRKHSNNFDETNLNENSNSYFLSRAMGIQQVRLDNFGIQSDRRPYYLDN